MFDCKMKEDFASLQDYKCSKYVKLQHFLPAPFSYVPNLISIYSRIYRICFKERTFDDIFYIHKKTFIVFITVLL